MIQLLTLSICIVAFGALALATGRQQEALFGRLLRTPTTRALRTAGWGALALALWLVAARLGWGLGLVYFSGQTSVAAGLVYLALIVRGRRRAAR